MGPEALAHVLRPLTTVFGNVSPDLLVGLGKADDAAVYRLNDQQAIVATTDFFPPVVDDPYAFGAIAAANALSDIYAMGGDPLFCLNLVAFPDDLDVAILADIVAGGADKVREAGAAIAGGHSINDREPKYGLVAIGMVHPARILTKGGAQPGDVLLLTKPLGSGVITTAHKHEAVHADHLSAAIESMTTLNAAAAQALRSLGSTVHACTDVTGYGLLGHAWEMASQSGVGLRLMVEAMPWLPGAHGYAAAGHTPGGLHSNEESFGPHVVFAETVSELDRLLLFDPQTSGGLLAAVTPEAAARVQATLGEVGVKAHLIGTVTTGSDVFVE